MTMHGDLTWLGIALSLTEWRLWVALAALMVLDVVQTRFFPRFGLKEGNPLIAKLMSQYGFDEVFLVKYLVFLGVFVGAGQGWIPVQGMWVAIALQAGVLGWNAYKMITNWRQQ